MLYTVFHVKISDKQAFEINARGWANPAGSAYMKATEKGVYEEAFGLGMVQMVAELDAVDLDAVFRDTNSIEAPWPTNKNILWAAPNSRSTSVGDLIADEDNRVFRVASFGFEEMKLSVEQKTKLMEI